MDGMDIIKLIRQKGTMAEVARLAGVSIATISMVCSGDRIPPPRLLNWLGYERVVRVTYRRKEGEG
jgi:transcriptional regulator with XRE-family HTH domain